MTATEPVVDLPDVGRNLHPHTRNVRQRAPLLGRLQTEDRRSGEARGIGRRQATAAVARRAYESLHASRRPGAVA